MQINKAHNKIKAVTHTLNGLQERIVFILVVLIVGLVVLYVYFVGTAIVHAVVSKEIQNKTAHSHSEVAELEVVYLSQKNQATATLAKNLGFVAVDEKRFAERRSALGQADVGGELQ